MSIQTDRFLQMAEHYESVNAEDGYCSGDMDIWWSIEANSMTIGDVISAGELLHTCGSTACIRGLAVALFDPERMLIANISISGGRRVLQCYSGAVHDGKILLGLTEYESNMLFSDNSWSDYWRDALRKNQNAAMARICRLVAKTGNVWFLEGDEEPK